LVLQVKPAYLLIPWSRVFLEKLIGLLLVKNFPTFCGTRRFITAFTSAPHLSLSWANLIQSKPPNPISWRSILISFHLRLVLPSGCPSPRFTIWIFRNKIRFYGEELLAPRPTRQAREPPLVICPRLLIQHIRSYRPYWRPFLQPQPENAPCCGDRDQLITESI
jgi:hypothetical protein